MELEQQIHILVQLETYAVSSRYVRVKSVTIIKHQIILIIMEQQIQQFADFLPDNASGSFGGAQGELFSKTGFPSYAQAKYYDAITDGNSQGLTSTEAQTLYRCI